MPTDFAIFGRKRQEGEHGTKVYFVKQLQVKDRDGADAETRLVPMMREYTVINVDQCDGLPDSVRGGNGTRGGRRHGGRAIYSGGRLEEDG
jgi:antirestriction protein ArdC